MENNKPQVKIFDDAGEVAESIAQDLEDEINDKVSGDIIFNLAISGGSTPNPLFSLLASPDFKHSIQLNNLHVYWVDERCVPPDDPESNYGAAYQLWLKNVPLPAKNIHRIKGEDNPQQEAERYAAEIKANVPANSNGVPSFDFIIMGIGNDGHTASIFPGAEVNLHSRAITVVAEHPETKQKRVSLTPHIINNAQKVIFMVTEIEKSKLVAEIIQQTEKKEIYPAGHINPVDGDIVWYLDKSAASKLK